MTKAKTTREDITQKVEEETWFTASEAVEIGFADKISESEPTIPATASAIKLDGDQLQQIINAVTNNLKQNNNLSKEPAPSAQTQTKRKRFIF